MGIGVSIFLIAVGATLAFALHVSVQGVDLDVVGWILIVAGVIGLIWALVVAARARAVDDGVAYPDDVVEERPVRQVRR